MAEAFRGGTIFCSGQFREQDLWVDDQGKIRFQPLPAELMATEHDCRGLTLLPGLIDPHVHLREPGRPDKETIASGTAAAAAGGVTTVLAMGNLNPVPDSPAHLQIEQELIDRDALIRVWPVASITRGQHGQELADLDGLLQAGCRFFSDDGHGVQDRGQMAAAMRTLAGRGIILSHCEDESKLLPGGCLEKEKAAVYGVAEMPREAEVSEVRRNIELARETGCALHLCHLSAAESVQALREAQREGLAVSGEVTVHHLLLSEDDITADDGRFKMNPPLRTVADREALLTGVQDGTIRCICTDHAPHTAAEKELSIRGAAMGIVGLETSFALIYTELAAKGILSLATVLQLMGGNAAGIFGIADNRIADGAPASFGVWDLNQAWTIEPAAFHSKGHSTPFAGCRVHGRCFYTVVGSQVVHKEER